MSSVSSSWCLADNAVAALSSAVDDDALSVSAESSVCFSELPAAHILHFNAWGALRHANDTGCASTSFTQCSHELSSTNGVQHIACGKLTRVMYESYD